MIEEIRTEHPNVILVDCGDNIYGKKDEPEMRLETILKGMKLMKYDAVNIADGELSQGLEAFIKIAGETRVPFVSSNVRLAKNINLPMISFPQYIIKEVGGIKVGITGITPSAFFKKELLDKIMIRADNSVESLQKRVDEMKKEADVIILLSHMGEEGTEKMMAENPVNGVTVAIEGHVRGITQNVKKVNDILIVKNSLDGEYLGKLTLQLDPDTKKVQTHELENIALTEDKPSNQEAEKLMQDFNDKWHDKRVRKWRQERKEKKEAEMKKYLHLTPQEFVDMMKKQQQEMEKVKQEEQEKTDPASEDSE